MSGRRLWIAVGLVTAVHATLGVAETLLMLWVVPVFAAMFADFGASLPTLTVVVLDVARWAQAFWWALPPLGLLTLAADVGALWAVGRRFGLVACLGLGALVASAQLLAPAMGVLSLYLPIFALADAVR